MLDSYLQCFQIRNHEDVSLLSRICKLHERAFYTVDGKHWIADQREIYRVKEHSKWQIESFARALQSENIEQLQQLSAEYPQLLSELYDEGYMPAYIHAVIHDNQLSILKWLYKQNSQLFIQFCRSKDNNPLHIAARLNRLEIGKWIYSEISISLNTFDQNGNTPLDIAENAKADTFAAWLISIGATRSKQDDKCMIM